MTTKKQKWVKKFSAIVLSVWLMGVVYAFASVTPVSAAPDAPAAAPAAAPAVAPAAPQNAGAVGAPDSDPTDPELVKLLNQVNAIANIGLRLISGLLWPVLLMIGALLNNDLIFGGAMGERLLDVSIQIRNLVNIMFVLILLAIAVYNVLGLGQEGGLQLGFKQALPKFVLALIGVNFSFIAIKIILDFSNVITGAVFALPSASLSSTTSFQNELEKSICMVSSDEAPLNLQFCEDNHFNERAKQFFSRLDRNNIAVVYAIKFGKAINLKYIRDGVRDITSLGFNILFNLVLFAVYALSFIALFLVLLFRLVVVWVAVALSPLIALGIVLPGLSKFAGDGGDIQDKVVQNIIAPITIGIVMSIGYIMLDTFSVNTSLAGDLLSSNTLDAIDPSAVPTDINNLQELLIAIGTVVIVWTGVFGAASKTYASTITDGIKGGAESFGKFLAKLPTYAPVIPMSVGGVDKNLSAASIFNTLKQTPNRVESTFGRSVYEMPPNPEVDRALKDSARVSAQAFGKEIVNTLKNSPTYMASAGFFDSLRTFATEKAGMKPDEIEKQFGKEPTDYKRVLEGIKTSGNAEIANLRREIESNSGKKIDDIKLVVERGQKEEKAKAEDKPAPKPEAAPVASNSSEALKILTNSAPDAARQRAFQAGGFNEAELTALQKQLVTLTGPSADKLKQSLIVLEDGKVKHVTADKVEKGNAFLQAIDDKTDAAAIRTAVDAALKTDLETWQITNILKAATINDGALKADLEKVVMSTPRPQK